MFLLYLNLAVFLIIHGCRGQKVDVKGYFDNQLHNSFQNDWRKYKKGIETSLEQMLQDDFTGKGMNVFVKRWKDIYNLTEGFLVTTDPVVEVVFKDLHLIRLPQMRSPTVTFNLASNTLKVDTDLPKVTVRAKYMVYRNESDIVIGNRLDMTKVSPFSLGQVETTGEVTIIGDECRLSGHTVTSLSDQSVNLGHNTFSLYGCKFSLEIWTPDHGAPPVFEPYLSDCDRNFLQNYISKPIVDELMSKLQGAMFSFVNTTEVFGANYPRLRTRQAQHFSNALNYMSAAMNSLNLLTISNDHGVVDMEPKEFKWTETTNGQHLVEKFVSISNLQLYGLDTAYSGHTGGPIQVNGKPYLEETIGFNTLQVKGKLYYEATSDEAEVLDEITTAFSAEIHDFSLIVRLKATDGLRAIDLADSNMDVKSWFSPQTRCFELNLYDIDTIWARALVTGHLSREIYTTVVTSLLTGQLNQALPNPDTGHSKKTTRPSFTIRGDGSYELWKNKNSESISVKLGKDQVKITEGNRTLFETGRSQYNK